MRSGRLAGLMRGAWTGACPPPIPVLPEVVDWREYPSEQILCGLTEQSVQPCFAALAQEQFLLISCAQDGSSTVQAIFAQAAEKLAPAKHIVFHGAQAQAAAAFDSEIAALMPEMQKRKDASAGSTDWPWILICIDDLKRCIDSINDQTLRRLASILVLGKGLRVAVIVSGNAADITKLSASGERFTMEMTGKTTLLLGGSAQAHMFARTDLAYSAASQDAGAGMGYLVQNGHAGQAEGSTKIEKIEEAEKMERSRLSIRALVVLASELGAEHLFGVRDPFMMMDHEEIRAAYEVCLEELEQSGAITRQFEGAAIVRGDLRRLIEICAECDLYLTVDAVNCGQAEPSVVLYRQGSCWAQLTKDGELASLTGAADGEIEELALARLMECCKAQEAPEAQTHWSLTNELLQHCLKDTDAGRAELLAAGMPEDAAALLLAGLERRCGYCCVNTVHLQTRTLESLCLVYDSDMLLRLEPGEEETEDWIVRRSTPEQIRRTLRALVREGAPQ